MFQNLSEKSGRFVYLFSKVRYDMSSRISNGGYWHDDKTIT